MREREQLYVDMEDPDIVLELRAHNSGQQSKYNIKCFDDKFLQKDMGLASLIPLMTLSIDILTDVTESWYHGDVFT